MVTQFAPLGIINQSVVKRVDIAGKEHDVTVIQRETGFIARSALVAESSRNSISANEAVQQLLLTINGNHPKQFEYMQPEKQKQLLTWIQFHLRKGTRGNTKQWSSYHLKRVAEDGVGFSLNNGEFKGAMLVAGLAPTKDFAEYDTDWIFVLERNPQLWSLVWRLVSYKLSSANVDQHSSLFHSAQSWWLALRSKLLAPRISDPVETPTAVESYVLSPIANVSTISAPSYPNSNM
jgi:hypothetical protein